MKLGLTVNYLAKKMCTVLKNPLPRDRENITLSLFTMSRFPGQAASFQTKPDLKKSNNQKHPRNPQQTT